MFEPVDISSVVGEMLELLKVSISKSAVLKIVLPPNLPAVRANAAQIRQVVLNLVTNASEAIGAEAGIITVATSLVRSNPNPARTAGRDCRRRLPPAGGQRYRLRYDGGRPRSDLRPVLYDEIHRARSGPGRRAGYCPRLTAAPSTCRARRGKGTRFEIRLPAAGRTAAPAARNSGISVGRPSPKPTPALC